ncbi:MAG: acyl-CoA thioester hydrolase [Salibacteraceae bacterium]|jgi:acyl-CoA thioester hydrolase
MKFFSSIDIRFRDLDGLGHVNNVVYLSYVEQARIRYFDAILGDRQDWNEWGVLLARTEINYIRPLLLKQIAKCYMECTGIGTKSMQFNFKITVIENNKELEVANGVNVLVCFNHRENKSIEVPSFWKTAIDHFEDGLG